MTVEIARFDIPVPDDIAAMKASVRKFGVARIRRLSLLAKVSGEYEDGSRERAKQAVDRFLQEEGLQDRTEMVTVIGSEGASTPCGYAIAEMIDDGTKQPAARLAMGLAHGAPPAEDQFDRAAMAHRVAEVVAAAVADAGLKPAEVVTIIVNVPQTSTGEAQIRNRRARAAAALGAGIAIGEIERGRVTDEALVKDASLFTRRTQTYIGPTVKQIEVMAFGNRPGAGGDFVACSTVTNGLFDTGAIKRLLMTAGLPLDAQGDLSQTDRIAAVFAKAGIAPDGKIAGAPTTVFLPGIPPEKHVRAALSGVLGAILHTTRVFSTFDPVQQAPLGGMQLCCILRA